MTHYWSVPLVLMLTGACAHVPKPVTRSIESVAHPAAPEAVTVPAAPLLSVGSDPLLAPPAAPATREGDMEMHRGHAMPEPETPSVEPAGAAMYTCPMHPQVKADQAGSCPICGMKLVEQETARRPQDGSQ